MASVNKVILVGHLGANPELKYLNSGTAVCEMRVATTDVYNDRQGQRQERTEWHRVEVFGKVAEACGKYLEKGKQVYVEGQIRTESWDDKETGQKRYSTKIVAREVKFLGGGKGDGERQGREQRHPDRGSAAPPSGGDVGDFGPGDDDIPF